MIETRLDDLEQSVKRGGNTELLRIFNKLLKEIDRHKSLPLKPRRSQRLRKGV